MVNNRKLRVSHLFTKFRFIAVGVLIKPPFQGGSSNFFQGSSWFVGQIQQGSFMGAPTGLYVLIGRSAPFIAIFIGLRMCLFTCGPGYKLVE